MRINEFDIMIEMQRLYDRINDEQRKRKGQKEKEKDVIEC